MRSNDFLKMIQEYYGEYPIGQLNAITVYVDHYSPDPRALDFLFAETLKSFSSQYKTQPDIAVFESLTATINTRLKDERDAITDPSRMVEDHSEYLPRDRVADMIGEWVLKIEQKAKANATGGGVREA